MDTYVTGDSKLQYRVRGSGETLLMIHGAMLADAFEMMADTLSASYQLITYRRRGFGGSSAAPETVTMAGQAADARALLDHLGVARAHVAGHSYGGVVALQLALDAPERVHSLGLLEPALLAVPSGADFGAGVGAIAEIYQAGDREGALVAFLTAVGGPDPVPRLDRTLAPGWFQQAVSDLPTLFGADLPSLGTWEFTQAHAQSITQPALTVLGTESFPLFAESHDLLNQWLPNAEPFVLDGATHFLQLDDPDGMANALLDFLSRHPMTS